MFADYLKYILKFNPYFRWNLKYIDNLEALDFKAIQELRRKRFLKLLHHAYTKSTFYRDYYDSHGVNIAQIKTLDDINKLPIIDKEIIKENVESLLTVPKRFLHKGHTSGSTGTPLNVYYDLKSAIIENAYVWHYRQKCGLEIGDPVVSMRGDLGRGKFMHYNRFLNTLFLSSYAINEKNIGKYISVIEKFKPKAILAYPSSLHILSTELKKVARKLYIPLAFTSSETLYAHQRDTIEEQLCATAFDWYGNAERTIALQQEKSGGYTEPPLYSLNEYREDHIVTTGLVNFSFPLIRYKTNDSVTLSETLLGNSPLIKNINGRNDDYIVLSDGSSIGRMDHIFKGIQNLLYGQIVQNKMNEFNVNIVTNQYFSDMDYQNLKEKILHRVGNETQFSINKINEDQLVKMKSGKFKMVINNVQS